MIKPFATNWDWECVQLYECIFAGIYKKTVLVELAWSLANDQNSLWLWHPNSLCGKDCNPACIYFVSVEQDPSMTKRHTEMMLRGTMMNSNHWVILCRWTPWRREPSRVHQPSCSSLLQRHLYLKTETQTTTWGVDSMDVPKVWWILMIFYWRQACDFSGLFFISGFSQSLTKML